MHVLFQVSICLLLAASCTAWSRPSSAEVIALSPSLRGRVPVKSWKDFRDERVVKQKLDYSCGAASLATLLRGYYGLDVGERDIIDATGKDAWLSFADMQEILPRYNLRGVGLALGIEQLKKLKVPAIIYINTRSGPHFAVLRGINDHDVWLADPATGNNRYALYRFLEAWETRDDSALKGKILLILPVPGTQPAIQDGFFTEIAPQSSIPVQELDVWRLLTNF